MTTRQVSIRVQTDGKAEVKRDFSEIGQSGVAAQQQIADATQNATAYSDRQIASWKKMAQAARDAQSAQQQQAKFNAILGVNPGSGAGSAEASAAAFMQAGAANGNLNRIQQQMLGSAAFRSFESLVSGASLGRVALQQGGEVADAFAQGDNGLQGSLQMLQKLFNPVTVGLGLMTAAMVAGAIAALAYESDLRKLDVAAEGLGSTSGLTGAQLEMLAETQAKLGDVSIAAARDMAASYVNTGRIGGDVIGRLIDITHAYSVATGQDAKAATAELGKAFADPAKGADDLNAKLHFLDDTTLQHIQTLVSQNKVQDAQNVLMDALAPRVRTATDNLGGLAEMAHKTAGFFQDAFVWYGRLIDKMAGGGKTLGDQISEAQRARAALQPGVDRREPVATGLAQGLDTKIAALETQQLDQWKASSASATSQVVQDAKTAMGTIDSLSSHLFELQANRAKVSAALSQGALTGADATAAHADLNKFDKEIAAVKAGFGSAAEQAAAFKAKLAEAAKQARDDAEKAKVIAAGIQKDMDLRVKGMVEIAKLTGDDATVKAAESAAHFEQLQKQFMEARHSETESWALAEAQLFREEDARQTARIKGLTDEETLIEINNKKLQDLKLNYTDNQAALDAFKLSGAGIFDKFATSLTAGEQGWKNWGDSAKTAILDVIGEFEKLLLINPLENALFNGVDGYKKLPSINGVGDFFSNLFGHNAAGTGNWGGGLSWVGERGPELVNLPRGSQVFSNAQSKGMGGMTINVNVDNRGSSVSMADVTSAVRAGVGQAVQQAGMNVAPIVNDGIKRRIIGGG